MSYLFILNTLFIYFANIHWHTYNICRKLEKLIEWIGRRRTDRPSTSRYLFVPRIIELQQYVFLPGQPSITCRLAACPHPVAVCPGRRLSLSHLSSSRPSGPWTTAHRGGLCERASCCLTYAWLSAWTFSCCKPGVASASATSRSELSWRPLGLQTSRSRICFVL